MNTTTITTNMATEAKPTPRSRVWWLVVFAFVVQIAAWTVWMRIASHNRVAEVPLQTSGKR
jgi:hypothetical protein